MSDEPIEIVDVNEEWVLLHIQFVSVEQQLNEIGVQSYKYVQQVSSLHSKVNYKP